MNETTQHSYESATARIEEIIRRLDSGEAGLRETLDLCREGRELVEFCAAELDAVGQGLEELRLDELVARLERRPAEVASSVSSARWRCTSRATSSSACNATSPATSRACRPTS